MLNLIDERHEGIYTKLLQSYDISSFEKVRDRNMLQALVFILEKKIQIEADKVMMRMAYNIIEAHIYYDFPNFISNEIRRILFKIKKLDFRHSSYLWWLLVHQNLEKLMEAGLQVQPTTMTTRLAPIDLRVPILTKLHRSYYEFINFFYVPMVEIMIGEPPHRLHKLII